MKEVKPYGSWKSPITAEEVASGALGLREITEDGGEIFWLESRPSEDGRLVVVRMDSVGSTAEDLIPDGYNARSRVHEYGGASYIVRSGVVYFTNFADQRVYVGKGGEDPQPVTPDNDRRYADFTFDSARDRLIAACEDHEGGGEAENYLIGIDLEGDGGELQLAGGHDFYSSPGLSDDGNYLFWLTWDHPNMPWDGTSLHLGELDESGKVIDERVVAGGTDESVTQPSWGPDGYLYFISDKTGWWNLYRWKEGTVNRVTEKEAEFGAPDWTFRNSTYDFTSNDQVICTYSKEGRWFLGAVNPSTGKVSHIDVPYTSISSLRTRGEDVFFVGGTPRIPEGIIKLNLSNKKHETVKLSTELEVDEKYLSQPKSIRFPEGSSPQAHGFYYPPENKEFRGPEGEKPPLIVTAHGGPTAATRNSLSGDIQFWTSRGFAFLDVNYRGSTGFGREHRDLLYGNWGVYDVEDCSEGAKYLVEKGEVDGERLIIRGGSAGGYTTLASLAFLQRFDAGASYFGVSDPSLLSETTHKFESRYLDNLIAPYPEEKEKYSDRSPIDHAESITCPVIFLQGDEDQVVPPEQAETMFESLKNRGIPTAYLLFSGEQHGFRFEENIKRALEAELYFYSQVFRFELPEEVEPTTIENAPNAE